MSSYRSVLRSTLHAERKAYGFTLVIWGSATLTASIRGTATGLDGVAYVAGAVGTLAYQLLVAFENTVVKR